MSTLRWNIAIPPDVDQSVRMFLAEQGGDHKGDLSRFIIEAVRAFLFEHAVQKAKEEVAATGMSGEEVQTIIDEAVERVRADKRKCA
jgi:hypothetical protein